jgi:hypothetical protein
VLRPQRFSVANFGFSKISLVGSVLRSRRSGRSQPSDGFVATYGKPSLIHGTSILKLLGPDPGNLQAVRKEQMAILALLERSRVRRQLAFAVIHKTKNVPVEPERANFCPQPFVRFYFPSRTLSRIAVNVLS